MRISEHTDGPSGRFSGAASAGVPDDTRKVHHATRASACWTSPEEFTMTGLEETVLETLPNMIGLLLAAFATALIIRSRNEFFKAVRGWAVALFIAATAVLWAVELLRDYLGGFYASSHVALDATYVVFAIWLCVLVSSLFSAYSEFASTRRFVAWLRERPLNLITVWGAVGLAVIVAWWASGPEDRQGLGWDSPLLWILAAYLAASIAITVFVPVRERARNRMSAMMAETRIGVALLATAGMGLPATEFVFGVVLNETMGFDASNPYAWIMVGFFVALVRSVTHPQFSAMVVDPAFENTKRSGFRDFDIPRGVYLIQDEKADSSFGLFSELVSLPLRPDIDIPGKDASPSATLEFLIPRGLVATREFPDNVRRSYDLQVTPIIWLTESAGERRIAPTSLAVLTDTMIRFMENNPNSIVLLEGVEYLITFNDFRRVLRSLDSLNETAWITKARLLITIDPKAFDQKDLAMLERDRKVLRGSDEIGLLKRDSKIRAAPGARDDAGQ